MRPFGPLARLSTLRHQAYVPRPILNPRPRHSSTIPSSTSSSSPTSSPAPIDAKQLSQHITRLGKCFFAGLPAPQLERAGAVLKLLSSEWRELLAGSEGYLTERARNGGGLWRRRVEWGDMDSMGHVNNVQYNSYAEASRVAWLTHYATHLDPAHSAAWRALYTPKGDGIILKSIRTDYKFPLTYPDTLTVLHRLHAAPDRTSSIIALDGIVLSARHRRPAARFTEENVLYDYAKGEKLKLGDRAWILEALSKTWEEQEGQMRRMGERAEWVEGEIRAVEGMV